MDRTKWPALAGLVLSTIFATLRIPTSFALDKPGHTSIFLLLSAGALVLCLSRWLPRDAHTTVKIGEYAAVPFEDVHHEAVHHDVSSREHSPHGEDVRYPPALRKIRIIFLMLVVTICLRLELAYQVIWHVQCSGWTLEPLVPFAFAAWDYWTVQRRPVRRQEAGMQKTVYDTFERLILHNRLRFVIAVGLVSFGGLYALRTTSSPRSTYICAASLSFRGMVPLMQHSGTILDIVILACVGKLLHEEEGRGRRSPALRFSTVGWAIIVSAFVLLCVAGTYYCIEHFTSPPGRRWFGTIPMAYFWGLLKLDFLICSLLVGMLLTVFHLGILTTSLIMVFSSVVTSTTTYTWVNQHPYPPSHHTFGFMAFCAMALGFAAFFKIETISEVSSMNLWRRTFTKVPSWFFTLLLSLFLVRTIFWFNHNPGVTYHPIDLLMWEAMPRHERYVNETAKSTILVDAVAAYRERYHRQPPPHFDKWFEYATARNSVVIDTYDSIHQDLLPFYALTPAEIRQRTWQMITNPWNDAAGISIRNGQVAISPNVIPTHRWMLDGLVGMIGHFSEWLPDMDLAFNLNDECRVAVPFKRIEAMRREGEEFTGSKMSKVSNAFSTAREPQWTLITPTTDSPLREISWQRTFSEYGSIACAPDSPARTQRLWDVSKMCLSCASPQSLGPFLANWTLAADVCHQPDLADLHGIYLSPAAFKGTHDLYPVFSQSKTHGFADILYPSAWNYIDKATYAPNEEYPDPPFVNKNSTLFWRGATSEGVSAGMGQWRGMTRQRFVHLTGHLNGTNPPQAVLLPNLPKPKNATLPSHTYTYMSTLELTQLVRTDVHVVQSIARCGGCDCKDQAAEFSPLASSMDFQSHWAYKYLLDLDGAGFSGRFLPFLFSRSLPFKAGVFREWWDDRLSPWVHFVPLDVRGQGLWATLVYFAGLEGIVGGQEVKIAPHDYEAEFIAERGREWAGRVLRKEDMEIYMFRLLLEWGRLTDDSRDTIGFTVNVG